MDENNQNKSNPITLVFWTGDNKNILVEIDDKKLKNASFRGIKMNNYCRPEVPYDWEIRQKIFEGLKTVIDATIVNATQKEAILALARGELDSAARRCEDMASNYIEDVREYNEGVFALDSGSLKIASDVPREAMI